ncbi:MAG: ATP-binding protein, partial [Cyanobacteria bacterium P01_A01_bin.37]
MNPLPSERAKTLKTAFRACDVGALRGDNIDRYYVDLSRARSEIAIQNVKTRLKFLDAKESAAILFTGHRGCGKSTELPRIEREWQDSSRDERYRVIYLEANDEIDINDADFKDLYLVIV